MSLPQLPVGARIRTCKPLRFWSTEVPLGTVMILTQPYYPGNSVVHARLENPAPFATRGDTRAYSCPFGRIDAYEPMDGFLPLRRSPPLVLEIT